MASVVDNRVDFVVLLTQGETLDVIRSLECAAEEQTVAARKRLRELSESLRSQVTDCFTDTTERG